MTIFGKFDYLENAIVNNFVNQKETKVYVHPSFTYELGSKYLQTMYKVNKFFQNILAQ